MTRGNYEKAIQRIDAANAADPNKEVFQGKEYPKELLYSQRMSLWLEKMKPDASEVLKLAARAQHICRWEILRSSFSPDRAGYLKWRTRLYAFHAEKAAEILLDENYDAETVKQVSDLLQKKNLKTDPDMQLLEDVICLVFLENYFEDFSDQHEEEMVLNIIRKTWSKMSPEGHKAAAGLSLNETAQKLMDKALG